MPNGSERFATAVSATFRKVERAGVRRHALNYASVLAEMRLLHGMRIYALIVTTALCLPGQNTPSPDAQSQTKGIPPRATPADYQSQAQAGTVTIAAEFTGHSLPTLE